MSSRSNIPTPPPVDGEEDRTFIGKPSPDVATSSRSAVYERKMGDTELSYFLPSRQTGVNDMYLHLAFDAPLHLLRRARVRLVWAILRLRHPLLSAEVVMHDYDDVRFIYNVPSDPEEALGSAEAALEFRSQTKDELVDSYLNGPRTLSNSRLSYLVISQPALSAIPTPPRTPSPTRDGFTATEDLSMSTGLERNLNASIGRFDVLFAAMHFLGDGMALHQCANDFFRLVACGKSDDELATVLGDEWERRFGGDVAAISSDPALPVPLEARLADPTTRFQKVATEVDFHLSQSTLVGGQTFPKRKHPDRHTVLLNKDYPSDLTKAILRKCKQNGVSISAAVFALCNIAWARMGGGKPELPTLMYSALNLRPCFKPAKLLHDSYWFLAIGYFNVILPSFVPKSDQEKTFWHRARQARVQSTQAAKNMMIVSRTREMAKERGERARGWAKEDDERERGTWVAPAPAPAAPSVKDILPARPPAPSAALMGLSLLGNLDAIYTAAEYPDVKLQGLTTGSRQRHGAMLLFGFTFAGKLCLSLGYDENGFAEGVVEKFWEEMQRCTDEFLV
ncbi:uncharacterized protein C8Q71DRAFT_578490 [Rhodofomes roseus]|uniref:Condensation domain-containing protein n=1 Tax=Rhodofomes roseus TaxID=34475 RepID=A0ABQ8KGG3_9APHY|nr:uncharacterized protein C8Q71DRAFT_578490 [Rhodofomes roseus]KAH9836943.1 hypothetical protein C8Q71DRAFT_578490 [Rhodofomes roseus]